MMRTRKYKKIIKLQEKAIARLEKNGRANCRTARCLRTHLSLLKQEMALLLQSGPTLSAS